MKKRSPREIEKESFRIIEQAAGPHKQFTDDEWAIVRRIIHATAEFDFMKTVRFSPHAVAAGVHGIQKGCAIYTDTEMLSAALNKKARDIFGCSIRCLVADDDVMRESEKSGETRSAIALRKAVSNLDGAIIAVGNAPTALHEAITLYEQKILNPALIIGMPVGFVEALESKERLSRTAMTFITNLDRKGGTPATAAAMNALIKLAERK